MLAARFHRRNTTESMDRHRISVPMGPSYTAWMGSETFLCIFESIKPHEYSEVLGVELERDKRYLKRLCCGLAMAMNGGEILRLNFEFRGGMVLLVNA